MQLDRIVRVFPRRTSMTPDDDMAFVGEPPLLRPEADEVHVSVTFTWDKSEGERLADSWAAFYPNVVLGGPAFNSPVEEFVPGMYLMRGITITSRGCDRRCRFCFVPKREGRLRTLPIEDGYIIQDNNLLACPAAHIDAVLNMGNRLKRRLRFVGGLDVFRFTDEVAGKFECLYQPPELWFSYDRPEQLDPLKDAVRRIRYHSRDIRCYVLIGQPGDTIGAAVKRLEAAIDAGMIPMAMLYCDERGRNRSQDWRRLQRKWARPAVIRRMQLQLTEAP